MLPFRLPTGLVAGRGAKLPRSSCGVWRLVRRGQRAVSLRLSRATSLRAGLLCGLPRPRWGWALSQLPRWQEKWSVPCHSSLLCCWLTHCSLMGPYPRFHLLLCPFQPSTIALFLLDSHCFLNGVRLGNCSLCQVLKTFSPLRFPSGEPEGKPRQQCALTWCGYQGAAPAESITGTVDISLCK